MVLELFIYAKTFIDEKDINIPKTQVTQHKLNSIIDIVFAIFGGVALIFIVLSGVRLMLSQGDPQAVNKARNSIIFGAIGLAISIAAFTIVSFVVGQL
jgi:hypothetical protein